MGNELRGALVIAVVSSIGVLAGGACKSSSQTTAASPSESSSADAKTKKLDCAFIKSDNNCWRVFAANMGVCLGGRLHPTGKLAPDLTTCTMEDEVMVKLGQSCDPDGECEPRDVFMGRAGKKCMEFHSTVTTPAGEMGRGAGSFEITSAEGTLKFEYDEKTKTLTCPDGTIYSGSGDWKKDLADCADEQGYESIPTYAFSKTATVMEGKKKKKAGTGTVSFELSTMNVLFECEKP